MEQGNQLCACPFPSRPLCFSRSRSGARGSSHRTQQSYGNELNNVMSVGGQAKDAKAPVNDLRGLDKMNTHDGAESQHLPTNMARATFSEISHVLADIRSFPRRITPQRMKNIVLTSNSKTDDSYHIYHHITFQGEKVMKESSRYDGVDLHLQSRAPNWLRRCVSNSFKNRRRTSATASRSPSDKWIPQDSSSLPTPVTGFAPPTFLDDHTSGAAARAAAAEQNEMLRALRRLCSKERRVRRDSESGIGIETQSLERETAIVRRGKS